MCKGDDVKFSGARLLLLPHSRVYLLTTLWGHCYADYPTYYNDITTQTIGAPNDKRTHWLTSPFWHLNFPIHLFTFHMLLVIAITLT
ncbi:hypothetical protein EDC04DRAFT_2776563 [Pisolithus marmoratus]|nr:hypothetical protein EDC04DRAFT_2776563 [Pisolithus marmoratus]